MKKISDLQQYKDVLPYDSEIFGVYQPMIGWRSKRMRDRIDRGFKADRLNLSRLLYEQLKPDFEMKLGERGQLEAITSLNAAAAKPTLRDGSGSFLLDALSKELPRNAGDDEALWDRLVDPRKIDGLLSQEVVPKLMDWHRTSPPGLRTPTSEQHSTEAASELALQLQRESRVAGYLLHLKQNKQYGLIKDLFLKPEGRTGNLLKLLSYKDPLEYIDPFKDIQRAGLSPIGVVHLFRQYFFEFDTFLGPAVGHVWLSPGGTVELMEVSTRKTIVERSTEMGMETTVKTEKSLTEQDDLSDAVKQDNKAETKFGMNATANQSWIGGSASASASMDMASTQSKARETTHKHMRQQTEKISTEIRKNYKT
ncbi:MAG: hypothetical protein ACOVOX_05165, partial [Burkholderiaceae bacterium]